jgi:V/A-type H+-transporting ATPase subunit E
MSKLEDILQQEVLAEIAEVTKAAETRAAEIIKAAQEQAEALKAARQKQLEAEHAAAERRAESAADLVLNQARIQARGQVMDRVRAEALKALASLQGQPNYGEILTKLAEEALQSLGQAEAVVVNPGDAAKIEPWARARGLELRTDAALRYGVRLVAAGGKSMVQNSLPERLERAWDSLSAKAAKAIWG